MTKQFEFIRFPSVDNANDDGLLAMGGDLNVNTLVSAYAQGIFPWFSDDQPILWWSPDPRMVLLPNDIKVSRSLAKTIKKGSFKVTCNQAFESVISACALRGQQTPEPTPSGTWITDEMRDAYSELHKHHYAHSIEVWKDDELVGGLYGVVLGKAFFGESMFSRVNDASKVGLVALCQYLSTVNFELVDCQVASAHLFSLGAIEIARDQFLNTIEKVEIDQPNRDFSASFEQVFPDGVINTV